MFTERLRPSPRPHRVITQTAGVVCHLLTVIGVVCQTGGRAYHARGARLAINHARGARLAMMRGGRA